jgi:hypothetical protein
VLDSCLRRNDEGKKKKKIKILLDKRINISYFFYQITQYIVEVRDSFKQAEKMSWGGLHNIGIKQGGPKERIPTFIPSSILPFPPGTALLFLS